MKIKLLLFKPQHKAILQGRHGILLIIKDYSLNQTNGFYFTLIYKNK